MQLENLDVLDRTIRERDLHSFDGLTNSVRDRLRREALYPQPYKLSPDPKSRGVGYSLREIVARQKAVQRGASVDELRALIAQMTADRLGRLDAGEGDAA